MHKTDVRNAIIKFVSKKVTYCHILSREITKIVYMGFKPKKSCSLATVTPEITTRQNGRSKLRGGRQFAGLETRAACAVKESA